jgi:hypothetical protein
LKYGEGGWVAAGLTVAGAAVAALAVLNVDKLPDHYGVWACGEANTPICIDIMMEQEAAHLHEEAHAHAHAQAQARRAYGERDILTFYRGTTYYDALETVQRGAFDAARLAEIQTTASYDPGLYLTTQLETARYYADLAGLQGRGGGPAILRISIRADDFLRLIVEHGIMFESPVSRPPFAGQTETLIPPLAIPEFNAMMRVVLHE